jgi:hypothetical protein
MKTLLKLALVALIANATWHLWGVYASHFKFKDAVQSLAQYGADKSEEEVRERILTLAAEYDVPITSENFTLSRKEKHTIIDGAYTRPVDLAPGFTYPWSFSWHVDTFTVTPPKLEDLGIPK